MLVDNETAVKNVTKMAESLGTSVTQEKKSEGKYRILIHPSKDGSGKAGESAEETEICCEECATDKGTVVAVSSDRMGDGDDELGRILMKSFLFAVTQLDKLPETILFYNGGAKLTVEGSESLEDLKKTMEPSRYVGRAPEQVDAFLGQVVKPILEKYSDILGEKAEINV